MTGALPLFDYIQQVRTELAGGGLPPAGDGNLAAEVDAVEAAKPLTAHVAGILLEGQAAELAQKQQHLELLSNMVLEVYALDSAIARTLKLIRRRGVEGAVLEIDLSRILAARCSDELLATARRLIANDTTGDDLSQRLREISLLSSYIPRGVLDTKARVAERVTAMYAPAA
ncbi:MAG TPA: hypothetical protein VF515_19040 [Candidatus Binatia bacterium]|jgi:hypothetical protein